ncbi:hypothetical protein KIF53_09335 [Chromobacterium subtsugae]|uniref:Spore coat protein U domain-containing protein n=1 Tax=Chromobacterium subtsugae TaxID=251747 RepID=A0ABS7FCM4_9NEIS|nr:MULTISPECIES: hypothetical protein [Chromobacterium]MBW7566316.1 hypothetical protein [Chromobacterium subtsugae]MBW8287825.1 hypothetical protein [Chromobacterium subtsugae]WSE91154.1 hypothetical protein U6115_20120 [Chromobacterium subtsugae]WVH59529.1 hypothetical protein U6151_20150 [Chromobacterium subtsugae]
MKSTILLAMLLIPGVANAEIISTCQTNANEKITISRNQKIADTYIYHLQINKKKPVPIFGTEESSRGSNVKVACTGIKWKTTVLSGEFSSNFMQGFTLNNLGRIDFSEKIRPSTIYSNASSTMVIFKTNRKWDSNTIYTIYKLEKGKMHTDESYGTNEIPKNNDYEVSSLKE